MALAMWGILSMGRRPTLVTGPEKGALAISTPSSLLRSQSDQKQLQRPSWVSIVARQVVIELEEAAEVNNRANSDNMRGSSMYAFSPAIDA